MSPRTSFLHMVHADFIGSSKKNWSQVSNLHIRKQWISMGSLWQKIRSNIQRREKATSSHAFHHLKMPCSVLWSVISEICPPVLLSPMVLVSLAFNDPSLPLTCGAQQPCFTTLASLYSVWRARPHSQVPTRLSGNMSSLKAHPPFSIWWGMNSRETLSKFPLVGQRP